MAGPLFRELAEDLAEVWPQSVLLTGHPDTVSYIGKSSLHIEPAPGYDRTNYFSRFISWVKYFFKALSFIWKQPRNSRLFIVSNPPFLGLAGLFFKVLRRQRYVMLVYDIYPDLLIALNRLEKGLLSKSWDFINRMVYEHASVVMTIDDDMRIRLEKKFDVTKTDYENILSIPVWADIDCIKPLEKKQNWFAIKYDLLDKTIILYSGNMGHSHDIETILEVAKELRMEERIHFVFIGEGVKWSLVEKTINEFKLKNITLLPFQPEEVLPMSISSGDIGVVTYEDGTQGCMSPSKSYYYMAAGLSLLVISNHETDLTRLIGERGLGIWVKNGDVDGMSKAVKGLRDDHDRLIRYKRAARNTAEQFYSRENTKLFVDALNSLK